MTLDTLTDLQWNGQHQKAIVASTSLLASDDLGMDERLTIMGQRIDSYLALAKYAEAQADIDRRLALAQQHNHTRHYVEALHQQSRHHRWRGKSAQALQVAQQAMQHSQTPTLRGRSLLHLAEAHYMMGNYDECLRMVHEPLDFFEESGALRELGRAQSIIASCYYRLAQNDAARQAVERSLLLAQTAGDPHTEGTAFNLKGNLAIDFAAQLSFYKKAQIIFQQMGNLTHQYRAALSIATSYIEVGLFVRANRTLMVIIDFVRRTGEYNTLAYALDNAILLACYLGDLERAQKHLDDLLTLLPTLQDKLLDSSGPLRGLEIERARKNYEAVVRLAQDALEIDRANEQITNIVLALGRLAEGYLHLGKHQLALHASADMIAIHKDNNYDVFDTIRSEEIWWIRYQILQAAGQTDEAQAALTRAYGFLVETIAAIGDAGLRRNYLNKFDVNRFIVEAWLAQPDATTEHLEGLTNTRDPFQRSVDTGMRLNTLRDTDRLRQFVIEEAIELSGAENVELIKMDSIPEGFPPEVMAALTRGKRTRRAQLIHIPADAPPLEQTSCIIAPLTASNYTLGMIYADIRGMYGRFTNSDRDALGTLANQAGVALENLSLVETLEGRVAERTKQLNARVEELQIINAIQTAMAAEESFHGIIELVGGRLRDIFDNNDVSITWYDATTGNLDYIYSYAHGQREPFRSQPPVEGGIFETLRRTQKPVVINDSQQVEGITLATGAGADMPCSSIFVPLVGSQGVIGAISLDDHTRPDAFGKAEVRLLTTLTNAMAVALESANRFEALQQRNAEVAVLNEVGKDISATLELATVLDSVTHHATRLVAGDAGAMWLVDDDRKAIKVITAVGDIAEPLQGFSVRYGNGIVGSIIETGTPGRIDDTHTDPRAVHIAGTEEVTKGERLMVTPLMDGDTAIGAMSIWRNPGEAAFAEDELTFLTSLAQQAVIAIQNARLFEEAEIARAEAIRANEAKSVFLANMSHELRTPLNAIIGFTRIVKRKATGILPDKQVDNLTKVLSSADHLLSLINTILDIAKIEAGRMDVTPSKTTLASIVNSCTATARPLLKPGVELTTDIPPIDLYTDSDKIRQILLNLLSNASKFTRAGRISVTAHAIGGQVIIDVADTGIGMTPDALNRVFEEFQQADSSTTRNYGGTGLGLPISRSLAELLGGTLTASSTLGEGSTFTLIIPTHYGEQGDMVHTPRPTPPKRSTETGTKPIILAIDDDPDALYLLEESLPDYQVIGVTDSDEGLTLARNMQPFAITLDIDLPDIDGWQILHQLKADTRTQQIPVIIISIVDNKPMAYQLGAVDYLVKPFDEAAIRRILDAMQGPERNDD